MSPATGGEGTEAEALAADSSHADAGQGTQ